MCDSVCSYPVDTDLESADVWPEDAPAYIQMEDDSVHTDSTYPLPELKYIDTDHNGNSPPATGTSAVVINNFSPTLVCLNAIDSGATGFDLIGNKITVKSLAYHFGVNINTDPALVFLRIAFIWDKQPNGVVPSPSLVYANNLAFAHPNINTRERFIILKSYEFPLAKNGWDSSYISGKIPIDMQTVYPSPALNSVPQTGALYLFFNGFNTAGGASGGLYGNFRVRYVDN